MAELLVKLSRNEVVTVARDGHQWGRLECREVYDAFVLATGRKPTATVRDTYAVQRSAVDKDGATFTYTARAPVPLSEREIELQPPTDTGVIVLPGVPVEELEYLLEQSEDGARLYSLALTETDKSAIRAGKYKLDLTALVAKVIINERSQRRGG